MAEEGCVSLKEFQQEHGLSVDAFAKLVDTTPEHLAEIIDGTKVPQWPLAVAIYQETGVDCLDGLLTGRFRPRNRKQRLLETQKSFDAYMRESKQNGDEVAALIGIDHTYFSRIRRGLRPVHNLPLALTIYEKTGVDTIGLLAGKTRDEIRVLQRVYDQTEAA